MNSGLKAALWITGGITVFSILGSAAETPAPAPSVSVRPTYQATIAPTRVATPTPYKAPQPQGAVNHYINSQGDEIQSPTHYDSRPAGASARCRDGTYSFSASRRGTCSHHGGVAQWY